MFASFITQFAAITTLVFIINYALCSIGRMTSLIGSSLILLTLSWKLVKCIRSYRSTNLTLTPFTSAVLVTGCDRGFGNLLVKKLNREGFVVYATVLDLESDGAKQLKTDTLFPHYIKLIKMDVTSDEDVQNAYNYVERDLQSTGKQLWGLANVAGILVLSHIDWGTVDTYRKVFDVNTLGTVRVTRTFLPLIRQSKGRIVNMASTAGRCTPLFCAPYSMSKHAVVSFSDALRRELNKWQIKVSIISPGVFATPIVGAENVSLIMDKVWQTTSESVKHLYGQRYFEGAKQRTSERFCDNVCVKLELVIDAMVHAFRSECPLPAYNINGTLRWNLTMFINDYLPVECFDQYLLNR